MRESQFILADSRPLTEKVSLLRMKGDCSAIAAPGQFVAAEIPGKYLRRPFSVCDWDEDWFTIVVERVGAGTEYLQQIPVGTALTVMTGLGNGFAFDPDSAAPLLIGGGTGLSPLVGLCRRMAAVGLRPQVLLGFRDARDAFGQDLFPGAEVRVAEDVFAMLDEIPHDCFYACGSEAMMTELCRRERVGGQVAFDVRMGCGFGACMGCSKKTTGGMKRVCKDGPVFRKEELVWDD